LSALTTESVRHFPAGQQLQHRAANRELRLGSQKAAAQQRRRQVQRRRRERRGAQHVVAAALVQEVHRVVPLDVRRRAEALEQADQARAASQQDVLAVVQRRAGARVDVARRAPAELLARFN
jgi:hypothetical protein